MRNAPRPRSAAIDALRVLGVVAVVVGHVWDNDWTNKGLYTWHVPLFFFLTGYFWKNGRSLAAEARNRFHTLGRPYLAWGALLLPVALVLNWLWGDLDARDVLLPIYGGAYAFRPFTAFWFVSVLLFAALTYRAVEKLPAPARWGVLVAGLVAGYLVGDLLARTPLSMGSAWPCLMFIATGQLFRRVEPRIPAPTVTAVLTFVAAAALVIPGWSLPLDIKQGHYGTPVLGVAVAILISAGLVMIAKQLFTLVPDRAHQATTTLAMAGFLVVLTHTLPLMALRTTDTGGVLDLALALVIPWMLGLALMRTPLSPWLLGAPQKTRAPTEVTT